MLSLLGPLFQEAFRSGNVDSTKLNPKHRPHGLGKVVYTHAKPESTDILSSKTSSARFQRIPLTTTDLEIRRVRGSRQR